MKKIVNRRYDGSPTYEYFRASDLGIKEERFSFYSGKWKLTGSRYFLANKKPKALIIFFHGIGDGRASYIKEISYLVKAGYLVYAYDNTGSMESEGNKIISLDYSLLDQKAFFKFLDTDKAAIRLKRYAVGHSWGGYNALISAKREYKIEKIVSLAGFLTSYDLILSYLPKKLKFLKPICYIVARLFSPKSMSIKTRKIFEKSLTKVLYIQGEKDIVVPLEAGYLALQKSFKNNKNFSFKLIPNMGHSVYKSQESEHYVQELLKKGLDSTNRPISLSMDLSKADNPNEEVWKTIFDFLA